MLCSQDASATLRVHASLAGARNPNDIDVAGFLDEALLFDFETARDHEAERLVRLTTTADHKEAVQAFIDKRKAVFTGT